MFSFMNSVGGNTADPSICYICKGEDSYKLNGRSLNKTSCPGMHHQEA